MRSSVTDESKMSEILDTIRSYQFNALKDLSIESCTALSEKFANLDFIIPKLKQNQLQELNEALEEFDDEEFGNIITDIESMSESAYSQEFFEICRNKGLRDRIIRFLQSQDKHDLVGLMEENEGFAKLRNRIKYVAPKSYKEELFNVEEAHHINLTAKLYQLKEKNKDVSSLIKGKTIPILLSIVAPKGGSGKTTIATNIAYILAELGYRVVVVDADHQCNASAEFMMRMYHVFGSIDGSTDDSYFNFDSFNDLQQLYSVVKDYVSKNDDKNTNVKDNCEKLINIYNDVFPEDVEFDPESIEDLMDVCLYNLRSEGKEFASLIQGVVKKPKSLKDKILKKRTEEQAVKSAILKIREFYSEDYKFIGKYGEAKREQTKEKVERSHLPTNNLMRLLTRLTDLKVQNIKSLYKLARESQLMHLTRSYSISGEGGLYLFPGSLLTDRVNMDPNWRNNDEHNKKLTFFNLSHILRLIAGNINADIVIIDQNPGATPLNQSLWSGSDYIIVPFEPSFFSSFSIEVLFSTLEAWYKETKTSHDLFVAGEDLEDSFIKEFDPAKIMGTVISKLPKMKKQDGNLTTFESKKFWVEEINRIMAAALKRMQANGCGELRCPNLFSSLISRFDRSNEIAQKWGVPISASHLLRSGLNLDKINLQKYKDDFLSLVNNILQKIVSDPRISDKKREEIMEVGFGYFHRSYLSSTGKYFFGLEKYYSTNEIDGKNFMSDLYIYDYLDIWLLLHFQEGSCDLRICLDSRSLKDAINKDRNLFKTDKYKRVYVFFHELKWCAVTISKFSNKGTIVFDNCDKNASYVSDVEDCLKRRKLEKVVINKDYSHSEFIGIVRTRLASRDEMSTRSTRSNASEEKAVSSVSPEQNLKELKTNFDRFLKDSSKDVINEVYDAQKIFLTELDKSLVVSSIEEMGKIYSKYFSSYDKNLFNKPYVSHMEKNVFLHLIHKARTEEDEDHIKTIIARFINIYDSYEYSVSPVAQAAVNNLGDYSIDFNGRRSDSEGNIYEELMIVGDGSCGFHAAGISREHAVSALKNQQGDARNRSRREILQELLVSSVEDSEVNHLKAPLKKIVLAQRERIETLQAVVTGLRDALSRTYESQGITIHEGNSEENLYEYALDCSQKTELEQEFIDAFEQLRDDKAAWLDSEDAERVYKSYIELFRCNTRNLWVGIPFLRNACMARGINLRIWYVHAENRTIYTDDELLENHNLVNVILSGGHFNLLVQQPRAKKNDSPAKSNKRKRRSEITPGKAKSSSSSKARRRFNFSTPKDSDPESAASDSETFVLPSSRLAANSSSVRTRSQASVSDSSDTDEFSYSSR